MKGSFERGTKPLPPRGEASGSAAPQSGRRSRRLRIAHLVTVDMSLRFLMLNQLRAMKEAGHEVYALSAPGSYKEELEAEGIRVIYIPHLARAQHGLGDLRAIEELYEVLRRERFDVLHTHTPKAGFLGRIAARLAGHEPVVHTIHGLAANRYSPASLHALVWFMERLGGHLSDHVTLQNAEDIQYVVRARILPADRCSLLGNGVDLSRFHPKAVDPGSARGLRVELGIPDGNLVVGMVARVIWRKGYREFFECARLLRAKLPNVTFVCAGPLEVGPRDAVPETLLREQVAEGHVVYAGVRTDVERFYAMTDVAVLPSYFPEGVPRALIEPAAMGKPLVAADSRGCRDVVEHGVNGFLVSPKDAAAFARAVRYLLGDEALRHRMGRASRERAERLFDEQLVAARSLALYEKLTAAR